MAAPRRYADELTTVKVTVKVTPAERALIEAAATASGLSLSQYVRQSAVPVKRGRHRERTAT